MVWLVLLSFDTLLKLLRQKLRDEVCGRGRYQSGHDTFNSEYIAAISISWPYPILIQAESGDHIIHPGFISHIREIDNWTLDAKFVEK